MTPINLPRTSDVPNVLQSALCNGADLLVGPSDDSINAGELRSALKSTLPGTDDLRHETLLGQTALALHFISHFGRRDTINRRLPTWRLAEYIASAFGLVDGELQEDAVLAALRLKRFQIVRVPAGRNQFYYAANICHVARFWSKNEHRQLTFPIRDLAMVGSLPPIKLWWPK